jgi:hypothetical protein
VQITGIKLSVKIYPKIYGRLGILYFYSSSWRLGSLLSADASEIYQLPNLATEKDGEESREEKVVEGITYSDILSFTYLPPLPPSTPYLHPSSLLPLALPQTLYRMEKKFTSSGASAILEAA